MTAAGQARGDGLSIGAVMAQLRRDFPDVTISKIRFLESEGLVHPRRASSGFRQFTAADVERLRFVLAAQRDHYLPLKVIKEQLAAAELGPASSRGAGRLPRKLVALDLTDDQPAELLGSGLAADRDVRLTEEELQLKADIDSRMLAELRQYGLIRPGAAGFYASDDVVIATTVKAMTEYGIEPRHLRAFRAAADREVGLLEQIVSPIYRHHDASARSRADDVARELAALSVTLHTLLVRAGVRGVIGS